jgi:dimeric dUTPase (all-alpha-NTP-PPase superfamily)
VRFIEHQRQLQINVFGDNRPRPLKGEELGESVRMNVIACEHELHEALDEMPGWKGWSSRIPEIVNRDKYVEELVDAAHFLANLLLAADVDDEEFERVYRDKDVVNAERQKAGYDV